MPRTNHLWSPLLLLMATVLPGASGGVRPLEAPGVGRSGGTWRSLTAPAHAAAEVAFTINTRDSFPISRFIYGANNASESWEGVTPPREITLNRVGGNRSSAYNWETNFSNAGSDYRFQNDRFASSSSSPGAAIRDRAASTFNRSQGIIVAVPMLGYVAGDACECELTTTDSDRSRRLAEHFKVSRARKDGEFTLSPSTSDAVVYQDEFVHFLDVKFPGRSTHPTAPLFLSLDNEPDIWHVTHKEIQSDHNDNKATPRIQTYAGFSDTSVVYAKAFKAVMPQVLIFGPGTATYTGATTLGRYPFPDPVYGTQDFFNVYLDRMREASTAAGMRLLDVLDLHFYPQNGTPAGDINNDYAPQDSAMIQARVQAPRSLWDPTYNDGSWVTNVTKGPIRLIPRLREQIAAHYPGTRIAFTEYYYGRGGDISGGIAQADVFGIFGREGVFAATLWPHAGIWAAPYGGDGRKAYAFILGAFKVFRNYDGAGSRFGDVGLKATTNDPVSSSIYASRDSAGRVVLVAINKRTTPTSATITLEQMDAAGSARAWLMSAKSATPVRQPDLAVSGNVLSYSMPALSVTTILLVP